ncbi:hypothetical protein SAMN04488030_2588 [Aliiroseovarius halocynthiae]|uniref:Uncharacterized protein n=1 Tax=Aliiroseovarius halocynthiae TaxID=985055 RepID=A0A545SPY7_9RHOB|nr:hypothetical protein [Aliiroseovarius halocynthiae]TQV67039.1 hypothetical protein FIL88_10645 [Aliiroseovarius halocynthiae]SMR82242.1 hypothetical protein SAMN04488030_2588 [Aliiroseovarius halocynthiae]
MRIRVNQFVEFAYGDKRRDKAKVKSIITELEDQYDIAKDRYRKFRDAMRAFESKKLSEKSFLDLYKSVSANKSAGYEVLSRNYLALKEDHGLIWEGHKRVEAEISDLKISTAWYLRTEASNQRRIICLHFGKEQLPRKKERGLLTVLQMAEPESAGVGILSIQPGTLTAVTRLDHTEAEYLRKRAAKFMAIANDLNTGS